MSTAIKAIDRTTVHRICSGQVVLSLAIAVKELVENAIDAGATTVEVKLKEYGSEIIEVSDNGHGVHPENFEGLTLKHHTSKLRDFSDLMGVETFGFRGEALSSLCALSDLSISTRHKSLDCGSTLTFDRNGQILENVPCARQIGSSVYLANIFHTLPVRHKEFHRNLKKEFNKMLQLLYAYCLVSTGVRITCTNQTKKGSKNVVLATQGSKNVKENVSCIFGAKQLAALLEFKETMPSPEVLEELKTNEETCSIFQLDGLISSCAHGSGRSAPDRQFYFINSRPCEPSKVSKAVNEVYHQYNLHQYPFIFLNIKVARDSVDVNVTPDKRQIFLDHERVLVAIVKASLERTFKRIPSTFVLNKISNTAIGSPSTPSTSSLKPNLSLFNQWRSKNSTTKRILDETDNENNSCKVLKMDTEVNRSSQATLTGFLTKQSSVETPDVTRTSGDEENASLVVVGTYEESPGTKENIDVERQPGPMNDSLGDLQNNSTEKPPVPLNCQSEHQAAVFSNSGVENMITDESFESSPTETASSSIGITRSLDAQKARTTKLFSETSNTMPMESEEFSETESTFEACSTLEEMSNSQSSSCSSSNNILKSISYDSYEERGKRYLIIPSDISLVRSLCHKRVERDNTIKNVRFRATIDPSKNDQAEDELRREISKDRFEQMEIIGQFNLGFIITKLDKDLFIIDQHASDEKFNFETLQKITVIKNQKLVVPKQLELTAANESVLMDNLDIFKKNGFEFKIDEDAPPTKKISMTSVPLSVNRVFGKDDVDELLFMLQDANESDLTCRPSGVRAMFASRACRKSVMVGTALDHKEMRRLVSQMGTIQHPWNCPHGRPTMRHLVNIELVKKV